MSNELKGPLPSVEATVRGALIVGLKKWVLDNKGGAALEQLVGELPEKERAVWRSQVLLHTQHHPASVFKNFGDAATKIFGANDPKYLRQIGAFVAINDLATYMKILMKLGTPSFVSSRFPRIWSHYFSVGELLVTQRTDRSVSIEVRGWQPYGLLASFGAEGWMQAALEYSGAKRVVAVHTSTGDQTRKYEFTWA